jgi:hypothetical protein
MIKYKEGIMQQKRYSRQILLTGLLAAMLAGSGTLSRAEEKATTWDQAEQEVKEAAGEVNKDAGAVKDVTKETSADTWQKTKDESRQIYHRAKDESREGWQKTQETSGAAWDAIKQETLETWEKVKEKSKEAFEDTKAKIHEATAPEPAPAVPETE